MPVNKDFYTLAGSSGQSTGYEIANSLRFNDNDSGFLLDAGTDAGDTRKKNTWSVWVKRGNISSAQYIAAYRYDATNYQYLLFKADDKFEFTDVTGGSVQSKIVTAREFRDPSAWYHIVCVWDTADGVTGNRARVYVNGVRETSLNTGTYPSQNADSGGAGRADARIRFGTYDATGQYFDGYLAEIHYTDNYAYDPPNFGEFKEDTDIWIPKEFTGSYGSVGAYLDFETTGTLGANSKGKGNFSLSGIASNDQRTDSPTNNHCVMNSIVPGSATFANGNLDLSYSASAWTAARGSIGIPYNSGIYYYEAKVISHAIYLSFGWGDVDMGQNQNSNPATPKYYVYSDYNGKYYSSTDDGTIGDGFTNNDVIGLWYDSGSTSNNLKFYRNGTLQSSGTKSFDFSDVDHVTAATLFYSSNSVEYRFDSAYWTNAPAGITSANAITTNNIGS